MNFRYPALKGWVWPTVEIVGQHPGPHLAVIAGVHVNETSSIEAAIRLQKTLEPSRMRGRISIMPVVNLPALPHRSQYVCPLDNKNINFSFPGNAEGSFAEAIAYALLNDWAVDADCLVDLHGGDLCENVAHFTVCQMIGDEEFDRRNLEFARCFDAELVVQLDASHLSHLGRSCTGRASQKRQAAFAEAGRIGLIEENNVLFHVEGVLRLAHRLGITNTSPLSRREPQLISRYIWIPAPSDGLYRYRVSAGQRVAKGTVLAVAEDTYGETIGEVTAPEDGFILWTVSHAFVPTGSFIMGFGVPSRQ